MKKLSKEQMLNVKGGVTRAEYCNTLKTLIVHNYATWTDEQRLSAGTALEAECTSQGY